MGKAVFDPTGRWIAYEHVPPYDSLDDYSYFLFAFGGLSGKQVWIADMQTREPPRLLQGLDPRATNFLQGFSPDGQALVVMQYRKGQYTFLACGLEIQQCHHFPGMPDISEGYIRVDPNGSSTDVRLLWTSNDTFVFPMRQGDVPNSEMRNRAAIGEMLWRNWNQAWKGESATASEVVSTGKDRWSDWDSGLLMEMNVRTGQARQLVSGRFGGLQISPDGRRMAAARFSVRIRPASEVAFDPAGLDVLVKTHPIFDRRYAPYLVDARTGELNELPAPFNVDPSSFVWSPDGRRLAVFGWDKDQYPHEGHFLILDLETGKMTTPVGDAVEIANRRNNLERAILRSSGPARPVFLDRGLVAFARPEGAARFDWYLFADEVVNLSEGIEQPSHVPLYADAHSMVVLGADGAYRLTLDEAPQRLTPAPQASEEAVVYQNLVDPADRRLPYSSAGALLRRAGDDSAVIFIDYDQPDKSVDSIGLPAGGPEVLVASQASHRVVYWDQVGPASRLNLAASDGHIRELAHINEHLNDISPTRVARIRYPLTDPDGELPPRDTEACLQLPPDYQPDRRYPLVVEVYPVPRTVCSTFHDQPRVSSMTNDLWASRGFIYMQPPMPLNYARTRDGAIAGMDEVLEQAVDAAVAQGYADPDRVVLYGMSQGGISSLYVATQTDIFKAIISVNGWADFYTHYSEGRGLQHYFHLGQNGGDNRWRYECVEDGEDNYCPFGFGPTPFDDPMAYIESSPVRMARNITAPVMLVHSDLDYFGMNQYDMMFGALERAGKEVTYVRYWGEGHSPSSPANIRDLWQRIDAFLLKHGITSTN